MKDSCVRVALLSAAAAASAGSDHTLTHRLAQPVIMAEPS